MTNYYSNSVDYNNDLDAFEARVRAEQAEDEIEEKPQCCCFEFIGDNPGCPIHGAFQAYYGFGGDDNSIAWDKERDELRTMGQGG